jgi:hypothetical protein
VIGPVPEYQAPLPLLLALGLKWHEPSLAQSRIIPAFADLDRQIEQQFKNDPGLTYLSAYSALCPADTCREYVDDAHTIPVMVDDNHLSNAASFQLVGKWLATGELSL